MQKEYKRLKLVFLNAIKVILIVLIATTLTIVLFGPDKTVSTGEYTVTVNKVSTVSVYVSGPGVILESSNNDKDVYKVDQGTDIRLHAINESRIFTSWNIENNDGTVVNDKTNSITTVSDINSDLTVSVNRRDAVTLDYGKYMMDRYVISNEEELIALQDILVGNGTNEDFSKFYSNPLDYDEDTEKTNIVSKMNTGYYLIANNFVVFNTAFVGIGSSANPFQGVVCGLNNSVNSSVFVTISQTESSGTNYYGLFKYLGENAVIRNLEVVTTVGITSATQNVSNGVMYIGGLAGCIDKSLLVNVTIEARMNIQVKNSNLHVGGIVGTTTSDTGFESIGNVQYNGNNTNWVVKSESGTLINAGSIVGTATNTYVKTLNVNVTNSLVDLETDGTNANTNVSLGNIFGDYTCTKTTTLENINIGGSSGQTLRTVVNYGNSSVGGLVGKLVADTSNSYLNIGKVDFNITGSKSSYLSTTLNSDSVGNVYSGGLIGFVSGSNCIGLESFKNRLSTVEVDGKTVFIFDYLFEGDYEISSIQNGTPNNDTYGKAIAGGLIGKGYIDINGSSDAIRSNLIFASPNSKLLINATQSNLTDTNGVFNDKEHASCGLVYGSNGDSGLIINGVNVYTNNTTIETIREIGSKAMGDLHTGGFIGYVDNSTLTNISLYFNNSSLKSHSLSYEKDAKNGNTDSNSAYCGGLTGQATRSTIDNITFTSYDLVTNEKIGTTSNMESIQNTIPGGGDYKGENYIGGIIGRIQKVTLSNASYIGSLGDEDYIKMSGHESPDSAFCGGIVGMIRAESTDQLSTISNCTIKNANIQGAATVTITTYVNPDIFIGGILGATYIHSDTTPIAISNCKVDNTKIYGLGNEDIAVYIGGVLGGATWRANCTIKDCYVTNSSVISTSNSTIDTNKEHSVAGGIIGVNGGGTPTTITNCVVIDTEVKATSNHSTVESYASGIAGFSEGGSYTISDCYSNAIVDAVGTTSYSYPISYKTSVSQTYYISKNVSNYGNNYGTGLSSGPFTITSNTNIYTNMTSSTYTYISKLYIETNSSYFVTSGGTNTAVTVSCNDNNSYHTTLANVWINAKNNGDDTLPINYNSVEEANDNGWFIIDKVTLVNDAANQDSSSLTNIDSSYTDGTFTYEYNYDSVNDVHYLENVKDNEDVIKDNYIEKGIENNIKSYTLKVYDNMLSLVIDFDLSEISSEYHMIFQSPLNTDIDNALAMNTYGNVEFNKISNTKYQIKFTPNETIDYDQTFYIRFKVGNTTNYSDISFEINLIANISEIVGVTYAEYTPPLNYYITDSSLGTTTEPYQLYVGSITKFIPIIKKSNDLDKNKIYILEDNIENYTYAINDSNVGTINSSGELVASTTEGQNGILTLTDKLDNSKYYQIYFMTVNEYSVSYDLTGADATGLNYASSSTDFYFEQVIRANYGGVPKSAIITIGTIEYDLSSSPVQYPKTGTSTNYILVYEIYADGTVSNDICTSWDENTHGYVYYVGKGLINGDVTVNIEYSITYLITFDLQCQSFNETYTQTMKYKVSSGLTYADFFGKGNVGSIYEEINEWANSAEIFGFVYKGFYMVDHSSSLSTYGISFEELAESTNTINTSITMYGRWSFLIELIEAPGTHIVTSFNSSFMEEHYEEDKFNRTIQIPINMNEGYVFTIEKDANFKGEANVKAYSVEKDSNTHVITEIILEKYHDNMYLYYVLPEYITGYLVVVTSVSNSDIIVGENTSSVSDEILPEDGVATFKYIVNHKNIPGTDFNETSYIYNSGKDIDNDGDYDDDKNYNLTLSKDFRLYFYEEVYSNGTISKVPKVLPFGTEIKFYYTVCYNGDESNKENVVSVYKVTDENTSYVCINDSKLLDLYTQAFESTTFQDFLGSYERVSEVYYCVITPPNGFSKNVNNETLNYIIEGGFYDTSRSEFISGIRSDNELANKDDLNTIDIQNLLIESSLESESYTVTPSRLTNVVHIEDSKYQFNDMKNYQLCELNLIDAEIVGDYIRLLDDTTQSIIESSSFKFDISELHLTLGYGLGKICIYGCNESDWELVDVIEVENVLYQEYKIKFSSGLYSRFRIDNISTNEIRINSISVVSRTNSYTYTKSVKDLIHKDENVYAFTDKIVGDIRHDDKNYVLGLQFKDSNDVIVENIIGSVYITVNGINYYSLVDQTGTNNYGKNVAYINLSEILTILNTETFEFTLIIPTDYYIYSMQLIESSNSHKPALGEVRQQIN